MFYHKKQNTTGGCIRGPRKAFKHNQCKICIVIPDQRTQCVWFFDNC